MELLFLRDSPVTYSLSHPTMSLSYLIQTHEFNNLLHKEETQFSISSSIPPPKIQTQIHLPPGDLEKHRAYATSDTQHKHKVKVTERYLLAQQQPRLS